MLSLALNCNKMYFDHLGTITPVWNTKTRQITPFFIYFFRSNCNNLLLYLKKVEIYLYFDCLSHDPFWSLKYLNFGKKLPIRTASYTFLALRLLKIYVMFCPQGSRKKLSVKKLVHFFKKWNLISDEFLVTI